MYPKSPLSPYFFSFCSKWSLWFSSSSIRALSPLTAANISSWRFSYLSRSAFASATYAFILLIIASKCDTLSCASLKVSLTWWRAAIACSASLFLRSTSAVKSRTCFLKKLSSLIARDIFSSAAFRSSYSIRRSLASSLNMPGSNSVSSLTY